MHTVVIMGLGYVGLPLVEAVSTGYPRVVGFDIDQTVVDALNRGESHVEDISDDQIADMLGAGFTATTAPQDIEGADVYVICVPTPLAPEGGPDLTAVRAASRTVQETMRPGALVVLESTTYPGTTEDVVRPILESSGLACGTDFELAFSPERVDPGNQFYGIGNTPKIVGGVTGAASIAAEKFYGAFVEQVVVARGAREAEMAKILENTYRHVNIALVNELVKVCDELDVDLWNAIELASTKPFGFQPFWPGPGVGGHCIPIDPNYLSHRVSSTLGYPLRFVELAQEINNSMPAYVVRRVQRLLNGDGRAVKGARTLLVGVTYKPDIADQRETPARAIARELMALGALVSYHDPHVAQFVLDGEPVPSAPLEQDTWDVAIVLQHHTDVDLSSLSLCARHVLDTRGQLDRAAAEYL